MPLTARILLLSAMLFTGIGVNASVGDSAPVVQRALAEAGREIAAERCVGRAKRTKQLVRNRRDDSVVDVRETIRCKDLVLVVYHAAVYTPPRQILETLTLHEGHPRLPMALWPGASREKVLAYAVPPKGQTPSTLADPLNDEGPDRQTAKLTFSDGKVASIFWWWSGE